MQLLTASPRKVLPSTTPSIVASGNNRLNMDGEHITMGQQLADVSYSTIPFDLDCAAFEPISMEIMPQVPSLQPDIMQFDNFQIPMDRRFSQSNISAQSLSPSNTYRPLHPHFQDPQPDGAFESITEEPSPVTDESISWKSNAEDTVRAEVGRWSLSSRSPVTDPRHRNDELKTELLREPIGNAKTRVSSSARKRSRSFEKSSIRHIVSTSRCVRSWLPYGNSLRSLSIREAVLSPDER
jgi:hypothetical protein